MPTGTWAPPAPEYLTAPGYETYAPTKAYGYSPVGGDWSGAYPGYGGGGGGLTSGDFGGGTDTGALGGLLSAASLLGGANNLSSFLTGKSLLDHAGISNPFSGLLGSEGARGIIGNTPWSQIQNLFGAGPIAQNAALTQALHPTGDIGNIAGLPFDPSGAMAPPGGTAPITPIEGPYQLPPLLSAPAAANAALFSSGPVAAAATAEAALAAPLGIDLFGGLGVPSTATFGAAATPALTSAYMTGAIPEFAMGLGGAAAPAAGAGAGAGGFAAMGAMGPLALAAGAIMLAEAVGDPFDPTAEARRANVYENAMQRGGGGIMALEQAVYQDNSLLQLIKDVTSGGDRAASFDTPHTSGGTLPISWSPNVSKKVQENMHLLEAASHAGAVASSQGRDTPFKQAAYSDIKRGATFNAANDPFGNREREAAAGGEWGDFPSYVPSGRNLKRDPNALGDPGI